MKKARLRLLVFSLISFILLALITTISHRKQGSFKTVKPLLVSLGKDQYEKKEPIAITVSIINPLRREILIHHSSFGLAEHYGEYGLYINDDLIRDKCRGHYTSNYMIYGVNDLRLEPMETTRETIMIPAEAALTPGSHEISYELRIPFYSNNEQFGLAPGETITIYLDPRDRPMTDVWRERFRDFINGNGEFVVKGKLKFAVK